MAHDISQKRMNLQISDADKRRIKDSLLLILVFIVGLLGSCYILHIALSQRTSNATGYDNTPAEAEGATGEVLYLSGFFAQ